MGLSGRVRKGRKNGGLTRPRQDAERGKAAVASENTALSAAVENLGQEKAKHVECLRSTGELARGGAEAGKEER